MPPITRHNIEPESDEHASSPARLAGQKRPRRRSRTPTSDDQVPQYIPKVRSCVTCRQQKIKCDVVKEPFEPCSHCKRLKKECQIDPEFKRIAKRDQLEHLNQQIRDLRRQLELAKHSQATLPDTPQDDFVPIISSSPRDQNLDGVFIPGRDVANLFDMFFKHYHQYCPILNPELGSDFYFDTSPLLGWTVVLVAARRYAQNEHVLSALAQPYRKLLWSTISDMPQKYHTVKALALLCTWPVLAIAEISSKQTPEKPGPGFSRLGLSELDPSFMLSGIMMQIAMQTGLHISSQVHELTQLSRSSGKAEIEDRQLTWAVCNMVAQGIAITYGKPWGLMYDYAGAWTPESGNADIEHRLMIMKFCDKMISTHYRNSVDPGEGTVGDDISSTWNQLSGDLDELESFARNFSPFNKLSLLATKLHFHAFAFFIPSTSPLHTTSISSAFHSAISLIQGVLDPELDSSSTLHHCTNYLLRTLISASCILLKILNSSISVTLDTVLGRTMFNACILALRSISVKKNDFPDRVAEAHTRMWRAAGGGFDPEQQTPALVDPLNLVIRSRMCVSHVYDYVWSWRRQMNVQQTSDRPSSESSSAAIELDGAANTQVTGDFADQPVLMSQMEDFDLFNTLDWNFDDNLASSWS
ncbi:hypothetical protein L207DRAFT_500780 [Hyaloscypha variabilis F]|uniref:Zn(2)-C6 fungal-type domain-containing protein n=1 Tax=Hyaloscypha variabilis (strain UAMH 11265 / GT02V1 / F) TaxID=1149755 RepID=A0A2J6QZN0_HYAVF|nr:hypothetical protein L207DRAFT_500780 [Hyaloscypha variabilis F]